MKKWSLIICGLIMFLNACTSVNSLSRKPAEDKAVYDAVDKLQKSPSDVALQNNFTLAYATAVNLHKANIEQYEASTQQDKWERIMNEYGHLNKLTDAVVALPQASKLVKIQRFVADYNQAKENAAADMYERASDYLNNNDRNSAQEAYNLLRKTDQLVPGYKDVKNLLNVAEEKSTLSIVINPVNYYSRSYRHWGLNNDYVQYELMRDLSYQLSTAGNNVKVYTDREAYNNRITPNRVIDISWEELFMPVPSTQTYTRQVSQQVQTGETADKKPIYSTVSATIYVTRKIIQARGSLNLRITEPATNRTLAWENFPASYNKQQEYATYRGDSRALSSYDWALINNATYRDPARNDVFSEVLNQVYPQLLSRIRSVTW